jgi:GNAT superfamily N-acetyltransferase
MATEEDVEAMCDVYFDAFEDSYIRRECFPHTSEEAREFWRKVHVGDLNNPRYHSLVVTAACALMPNRREIISFAKWIEPESPTLPSNAIQSTLKVEPSWPSDGNPELANAFFGATAAMHNRLLGDVSHWYLDIVATRKEFQRKGAARSLITWGLERADATGALAYLDASPAGRTVYEKFGFEALTFADFGSGENLMTECFMARKGKATEEQWSQILARV